VLPEPLCILSPPKKHDVLPFLQKNPNKQTNKTQKQTSKQKTSPPPHTHTQNKKKNKTQKQTNNNNKTTTTTTKTTKNYQKIPLHFIKLLASNQLSKIKIKLIFGKTIM